jgi:trans-aconitate methyltransferase
VSFAVPADAYDRFMGRYSRRLAPAFLDFARIDRAPVLDVGCGPGALTKVLVERFGPASVVAADPSEPFVDAARERHPGVRVELSAAEEMPFSDGEFAASLAQLVVHFMADASQACAR